MVEHNSRPRVLVPAGTATPEPTVEHVCTELSSMSIVNKNMLTIG